MPGIASKGRVLPKMAGVDVDQDNNRNRVSIRGAILLLILLVLILGTAFMRLRNAEAQVGVRPSANAHSSVQQSTPLKKEEQAMVVEPTEANDAEVNPDISASIQVNGKSIALPDSGETVHRETIENNGTKTTVDVQFDSSTSGSSVQSQSNLNLNIQSSQVVESDEE